MRRWCYFPFHIIQERFCFLLYLQCYLHKWGWLCFVSALFVCVNGCNCYLDIAIFRFFVSFFLLVVICNDFKCQMEEMTNVRCDVIKKIIVKFLFFWLFVWCAMNNKEEKRITKSFPFQRNTKSEKERKKCATRACVCVCGCQVLIYICVCVFFAINCYNVTNTFLYAMQKNANQIR